MEDQATTRRCCRAVLVPALLVLGTVFTFWPLLHCQFTSFDDGLYVTQNPHVLSGLTWDGVRWAFNTGFFGNWHPLTWISHMLDVQLFGLNPAAHHSINLLFHTLNTVVLFLLLQELTGATWRSAFVAALFAWHPLHVESVAWISERKDMLSGLFFLLTLWAWAKWAKSIKNSRQPVAINDAAIGARCSAISERRSLIADYFWYILALFSFALGLMSKPMVVTLPFVLLLLDYWPLGRVETSPRRFAPANLGALIVEKIPFFALAAGASIVGFVAQQKAHALSLVLPLSSRLANAIASYVKYISKTFWPTDLVVYYPHPDVRYPMSHQWPAGILAVAALALVAVCVFAVVRRKTLPWLPMGWFWYLGTLVPVIGIIQGGTHGMADRYTYLPLIGLFICIAWGMVELFGRSAVGRRLLSLVAVLALGEYATAAHHQTHYWYDTETLFRHALAVNPENAPAHFKLGSLEGSRGNFTSALDHFRAAIAAEPNYISAYYSLGMTLEGLGKPEEALDAYQSAVRIAPWFDAAQNRLGMLLSSLGRTQEACRAYSKALEANPDSVDAHFNYGAVLLQLGDPATAVEQFRQAVRLSPGDAGALAGLGRALDSAGKTAEAIAAYQTALNADSNSVPALRGLAWIRATAADARFRDGAQAVRLAEHACQQTGSKDPRSLASLDAAYAETGRFSEALSVAEKSSQVASAAGQTDMARAAQDRLALYRQQRPFRQSQAGSRESEPLKH